MEVWRAWALWFCWRVFLGNKKNQWIGGLGRYAKVFCIKLSDLTREEIAAFLLTIEIYQFV